MDAWWALFSNGLPISLAAMRRYPLRTALSVLGVVIGVAAVIAMLSVSEGGRQAILRQVDRLGLQNLVVQDHIPSGDRGGGLRLGDVEGITRLVPSVARAAGVVEQWEKISGPAGTTEAPVMGITADYVRLRRLGVSAGRLLTAFDRGSERVCLLGAGAADTLFGALDPIGRVVSLDREWFTVVGVLGRPIGTAPSADLPFPSSDHDAAVLVPLAALYGHDQRVPDLRINQLWIESDERVDPLALKPLAEAALQVMHGDRRDFQVHLPVELLAHRLETQRVFNVVVGSVACLALLVGGIGIMNIMLAGVIDRTPEIGLRRTVGATRRSIAGQFIVESVVMTSAGGVFGVIMGTAAAVGITHYAGWPVHVGTAAVLISLGAAAAVGLIFGTYPAVCAARLQPIDAVRYE